MAEVGDDDLLANVSFERRDVVLAPELPECRGRVACRENVVGCPTRRALDGGYRLHQQRERLRWVLEVGEYVRTHRALHRPRPVVFRRALGNGVRTAQEPFPTFVQRQTQLGPGGSANRHGGRRAGQSSREPARLAIRCPGRGKVAERGLAAAQLTERTYGIRHRPLLGGSQRVLLEQGQCASKFAGPEQKENGIVRCAPEQILPGRKYPELPEEHLQW